MMKLETSIQDNKTIQNLKFNTETKLVRGGPRAGCSRPPGLQVSRPSSVRGLTPCCPRHP